jgi:hypothetical protein
MPENLKQQFLTIVKQQITRAGIDELLKWLEKTDFFTAPASTRFHLAYEGGLLEHSLNVYSRLVKLYEFEHGEQAREKNGETLAIVALFHDFCKINTYKKEWKNVKVYCENGSKRDAGGKFEWETRAGYSFDEKFCYGGHGDKSVFLVERFIKLTPDEAVAIRNHMGAYDRPANDYTIGNVFNQSALAFLVHIADGMASFLDEKEKDDE